MRQRPRTLVPFLLGVGVGVCLVYLVLGTGLFQASVGPLPPRQQQEAALGQQAMDSQALHGAFPQDSIARWGI